MSAVNSSRLHPRKSLSHKYSLGRSTRTVAPSPVQAYISEGWKQYQATIEAARLHKSQANLDACIFISSEPTCPLRRSRSDTELDKPSSLPDSLLFQLEVERRARDALKREKDELFRTTICLTSEVERARNACEDLRFKLELAKTRNPATDLEATRHFLSQSSSLEWPKLFPLDEEVPTLSAMDKVHWWGEMDARTTTTKRDSGFHSELTLPMDVSRDMDLGMNSPVVKENDGWTSPEPSPPKPAVLETIFRTPSKASAMEDTFRTPSPSRCGRRPATPQAPRPPRYNVKSNYLHGTSRPPYMKKLNFDDDDEVCFGNVVADTDSDDDDFGARARTPTFRNKKGEGEVDQQDASVLPSVPPALEFIRECNRIVTNLNRDAAQILAEMNTRKKDPGFAVKKLRD